METTKKIRIGLAATAAVAPLVWWAWPSPLVVETAKVVRGPLAQGVEDARFVLAEKPDALKVPVGALFRKGDRWAVFLVNEGRARDTTIELGLRGTREAEVTAGLAERDTVILYPPAGLAAGDRVVSR